MSSKYTAAIVDLDNCISEDNWRWPLFDLHLPIPNDRYWRYHAACHGDTFMNQDVISTLRRQGHQLIVCTSRPELVRSKTQNWFRKWNLPISQMLMRPNDNQEGSVVLKRRMLDQIRLNFDVVHAIDDRTDILDMYADEGVRICQRVFIHNPEIVHP